MKNKKHLTRGALLIEGHGFLPVPHSLNIYASFSVTNRRRWCRFLPEKNFPVLPDHRSLGSFFCGLILRKRGCVLCALGAVKIRVFLVVTPSSGDKRDSHPAFFITATYHCTHICSFFIKQNPLSLYACFPKSPAGFPHIETINSLLYWWHDETTHQSPCRACHTHSFFTHPSLRFKFKKHSEVRSCTHADRRSSPLAFSGNLLFDTGRIPYTM